MPEPKRQHRRYRVTDLQGTLKFAHPVTVIDISRSGAAVETGERLVPGRSYPLQLESSDGITVSTLGRVVWCKLSSMQENEDGESAPLYRAGLEFHDDLPEPAGRLFERLDEAELEAIDTSLRARYKMTDLASTLLLRERSTFEVRMLSRGGLAAEMEHRPRIGSILDLVLPLDEPVEVRGRVADVHPADEDPRLFLVGVEFIALTPLAQGQLDRYIERLRSRAGSGDS